ncbi:hypothetical protein GZH47_20495 [Paenibacillus rhizovicinus]|uniref:Uncharacterized protein n=1 Tax=Paenibacillus rhizovicinus TaxID=2704463 RepID=A0A6C0P363_9BACL|nr:hypothetical protein [Paenibacillus rhizovicinus]QHW32938.1 hypothetical protein GZH47_20495 [Paenibacillus rhizovicinus]
MASAPIINKPLAVASSNPQAAVRKRQSASSNPQAAIRKRQSASSNPLAAPTRTRAVRSLWERAVFF